MTTKKISDIEIEQAVKKDLIKKRKEAMIPFEVSRAEFIVWYHDNVSTGVIPWTEPAVSWLFAAWVASEGEREWLTQEQKDDILKRAQLTQERKEIREAKMAERKKNER